MKDEHTSDDPLNELPEASPEKDRSGGRPSVRLRVIEVSPIGVTPTVCEFASGVSWFGPRLPIYPESPKGKALRDVRTVRGLSLREVASAVGLKVERLGGLERGRYTLTDEQWDWLLHEVATLEATP